MNEGFGHLKNEGFGYLKQKQRAPYYLSHVDTMCHINMNTISEQHLN